jgi:hypothetical protein
MGHLPIVSESSLKLMIKKGAVLVMVPGADCRPSQKWADILADALCIRKGDPIFPWVVKSKQTGFSYQFKASDSAFLVNEAGYHIGIPVEPAYQQSSSHLTEGAALDFFPNRPGGGILWNAIGKKSLRRGRAITHQTPQEDTLMLGMLGALRDCRRLSAGHDLEPCVTSFISKSGVEVSARGKIASLELHSDKWIEDGHFRWEKALEACLISVLGTKAQQGFLDALGMPNAKVIWFANYLTFGVQGGSIDLLLLVRDGALNKAVVIELKKGGLAPKPLRKAVAQVMAYSLYVEKAFSSFGEKIVTVPVVVSGLRNRPQRPLPNDGVMHVLYQIEKGSIVYREA